MPMIGFMNSVRMCESGNSFECYVNCEFFMCVLHLLFGCTRSYLICMILILLSLADTVVDFANREHRRVMNTVVPVPVLNEQKGTLCGVRVNLHAYITDHRIREEIQSKLEAMQINVKYKIPLTKEIQERKSQNIGECALLFF